MGVSGAKWYLAETKRRSEQEDQRFVNIGVLQIFESSCKALQYRLSSGRASKANSPQGLAENERT